MSQTKESLQPQKKHSYLLKTIMILMLMTLLFIGAIIYQTIFAKSTHPAHVLSVGKGDTFYSLLVSKPWQTSALSSNLASRLYLRFYATGSLYQGVYRIPEHASLKEVVDILNKGAKVAMVKVQIIEGKTIKDLYHTLKSTQGITLEVLSPKKETYTWADVNADNQAVAKALGISSPNGNLEGYFAPDTYFFAQGSSDKAVLQRLYDTQKTILEKAWQNRDDALPYNSPYEALIMASIIEKETGIKSERHDVSAVFVNRLRQGMKLQTDPTIIYGLFDRYDGKIYKSNISEKTDYNTYQIDGLPPTPIALPSAAAIEAVMHPSDVPYIYFVATGDGGHKFSITLDEHNKAVAQYRAAIAQKAPTDHQNQSTQAND